MVGFVVNLRLRVSLFFFIACSLVQAQTWRLKWVGELHTVVGQGQDQARVELSSLRDLPHLYALGPATGRDGEVSIFDGQLFFAQMKDGSASVSPNWQGSAAFLAFAQVSDWVDRSDVQVSGLGELDRQLAALVPEQPLVFRLRGLAKSALIHIIDRRGRTALGHEANRKLGVPFQLKDEPVECFGVYSLHHEGILTHHGSHLHVHLRTLDGRLAGHLDQLEMESGNLATPVGSSPGQ